MSVTKVHLEEERRRVAEQVEARQRLEAILSSEKGKEKDNVRAPCHCRNGGRARGRRDLEWRDVVATNSTRVGTFGSVGGCAGDYGVETLCVRRSQVYHGKQMVFSGVYTLISITRRAQVPTEFNADKRVCVGTCLRRFNKTPPAPWLSLIRYRPCIIQRYECNPLLCMQPLGTHSFAIQAASSPNETSLCRDCNHGSPPSQR